MPKLVKFYIQHVLIGFGLSAVFVAALLALNVGNLWHLVSTSDIGWIAVAMLFMGNGIIFAGVQFAVFIMTLPGENGPSGGKRAPVATNIPARIAVETNDAHRGPKNAPRVR